MSSFLHMQGEVMATQPLVAEAGNALLWNGEVFGGLQVLFLNSWAIGGKYKLNAPHSSANCTSVHLGCNDNILMIGNHTRG